MITTSVVSFTWSLRIVKRHSFWGKLDKNSDSEYSQSERGPFCEDLQTIIVWGMSKVKMANIYWCQLLECENLQTVNVVCHICLHYKCNIFSSTCWSVKFGARSIDNFYWRIVLGFRSVTALVNRINSWKMNYPISRINIHWLQFYFFVYLLCCLE